MGICLSNNFDPTIRHLIAAKVGRLVRGKAIRASDREDAEQELALHVFQKQLSFNPARAKRCTFHRRIIERKIIDLLRSVPFRRSGWATALSELDPPQHERLLASENDTLAAMDLSADVGVAVSELPADLRATAALLMQHSPAAASRLPGQSRGRLRHQCLLIGRHLRSRSLAPEYSAANNQSSRRFRKWCSEEAHSSRRRP